MNNSEQPAFPVSEETTDRINAGVNIYFGITKREYFAGLAMQGLISGGQFNPETVSGQLDISQNATGIADAILAELSKPQP